MTGDIVLENPRSNYLYRSFILAVELNLRRMNKIRRLGLFLKLIGKWYQGEIFKGSLFWNSTQSLKFTKEYYLMRPSVIFMVTHCMYQNDLIPMMQKIRI